VDRDEAITRAIEREFTYLLFQLPMAHFPAGRQLVKPDASARVAQSDQPAIGAELHRLKLISGRCGRNLPRTEPDEIAHAGDCFKPKGSKLLGRCVQVAGFAQESEDLLAVADLSRDAGGARLAEQRAVEAGRRVPGAGLGQLLRRLGFSAMRRLVFLSAPRDDHLPRTNREADDQGRHYGCAPREGHLVSPPGLLETVGG